MSSPPTPLKLVLAGSTRLQTLVTELAEGDALTVVTSLPEAPSSRPPSPSGPLETVDLYLTDLPISAPLPPRSVVWCLSERDLDQALELGASAAFLGPPSRSRLEALMAGARHHRSAEAEARAFDYARQTALEHSSESIEIADGEGTLLWVNRAFERLTGWPVKEAIGSTPARLLRSRVHRPEIWEVMRTLVEQGGSWSGRIVSHRRDGTPFENYLTVTGLLTPGHPFRIFATRHLLPDVSEELEPGDDIPALLSRLQYAHTRHRALFDSAMDGILIVDVDTGFVLDANLAAQRMLGLNLDLLRQRTGMSLLLPEGRATLRPLLAAVQSSGICSEIRLLFTRQDNAPFWGAMTLSAYPIGHRNEYVAIIRDITSQVEAETRLKEAYDALQQSNEALEQAQAQLRAQSIRDPLTGLFNRRFLEESLEHVLSRSRRHGTGLAIMLLDLDHFKRINDTWGHQAGDAVLRGVGQVLSRRVRAEDIPCRYGGEEMLVILPDLALEDAARRAEELRVAIRDEVRVELEGEMLPSVTVSIGVATLPESASDMESLLAAADRRLYRAKRTGRNRVISMDEPDQVTSHTLDSSGL